MTTPSTTPDHSIPYATPVARGGSRGWAGFGILFGGLCLVGLGGCFLIGVLGTVQRDFGDVAPRPALTTSQMVFVTVLYACAMLSFGGATILLIVGTRALLAVSRGVQGRA